MKLFRDCPEYLRERRWPEVIPLIVDAILERGGDVKQLKNGLPTKPVCVENTNNAYSAVTNSNEFSTNEKPGFTSSYTCSVSTNEKAGGRETRKVGGKIYPVRLPGNLGR